MKETIRANDAPAVQAGEGQPSGAKGPMLSRKEMMRRLLGGMVAMLAAPAVVRGRTSSPEVGPNLRDLPRLPEQDVTETHILRMMRDLQRALKKPKEKRRWSMVIDLRKCAGCNACTVACIAENHLPPGVVYRPVIDEEVGKFPHVTRRFIPRPCMHCEEPPCVPVCPVQATYKRADGIVAVDYDQCIGCRYCVTACPYNARTFDFGEFYTDKGLHPLMPYEQVPTGEYGRRWDRHKGESPVGNVRKCHFCAHRIEKGLLPQCVVTCIGRATFFGDANDDRSLVSELIGRPNVMRLKEELGTRPSVYYLI